MPRQDQTGPAGMGPMTGRGAGNCAGVATNQGLGRGRGGAGCGRGRGMGRRAGFGAATLISEEHLESLKTQAAGLELQFKALTEQIGKLESE